MTKITDEFGVPIKYQERDEKLRLLLIPHLRPSKQTLSDIISQINQLFSEGKKFGVCSNRKPNRYCKLSNKFCPPKDEVNCEGFKIGKDKEVAKLDYPDLVTCDYGDTDKVIDYILVLAKKINEVIEWVERKR